MPCPLANAADDRCTQIDSVERSGSCLSQSTANFTMQMKPNRIIHLGKVSTSATQQIWGGEAAYALAIPIVTSYLASSVPKSCKAMLVWGRAPQEF